MALYKSDFVDIDLNSGSIHRSFLNRTIGEGDTLANRFGIRAFRGGEPEELAGSCTGYFIRPDGGTVTIIGTITRNEAYVDLPNACYAYEGQFALAIKVIGSGVTSTIRIVDGVVANTTTDTVVDPGTIIPSIETLIAEIQAAIGSIPEDHSTITNDIARLFNDNYIVRLGAPAWEQGGLNAYGVETESTTRIRTSYITNKKRYSVALAFGYKARIGYYSGSSYDTFIEFGEWLTGSFVIDTPYNYRIIVGKADDSTIVPADGSNCVFNSFTPIEHNAKIGVSTQCTPSAYWNVETTTAVKTDIAGQFFSSDEIPVKAGEVYQVTAVQGNTDKTRIWVATDDSLNIVAMCDNFKGTVSHTVTFTIPTGATKLLLTKQGNATTQKCFKLLPFADMFNNRLSGKKLSLLGDSISSYTGTIPAGNDVYYTGSNSGVYSANQMWWSVLCDLTGLVPLVINGWSGSGVTQLEDSAHVDKVPMSSDARCAALDDGINDPDIILIAGGVNDYTYAESAQSEPLDWDGKTAPIIGNSFTEAYACMIKKLQTNYPNAIIVALSTWFTMRGTDNGYTLTHTVGSHVYTQQDYNDKIRYVAEQMHIPYVDVSNIGINRNNMYPTYAQDSSTIPTHPNANGQMLMGNAIANKLIELVGAYL